VARALALASAIAVSLLAVSGAGGAGAQTPNRGGTLVLGWPVGEPPCLNVLDIRCNPPVPLLAFIAAAVLEAPYEVRGNVYRPQLATATYTTKRPFTVTYRIHPDAHWSDGVAITSRDFVFTLRAIRRYGDPAVWDDHRFIRSIRTVDAKTVRIVLRPRYGGWRNLFGYVLPEHALRGEDLTKVWIDRIDNPKTGRPIGSGPFLVERWERGHSLVLRRNPNYWGPRPAYLDRLVIRFTQSFSERAERLLSGELDAALGVSDEDTFVALRRNSGLKVAAVEAQGFEHFAFRVRPGGHPALRNKLVRKAFAYGVDRVAIARRVHDAIYPNARPLDGITLLANSPRYEANWRQYRYNPPRARALLEQAGCRRGADGIYVCAGERLSLRMTTPVGPAARVRTFELVVAQLRQVGIEVRPAYVSGAAFFGPGGVVRSGDFDVVLFAWTYSPDSTGLEEIFGCGGSDNTMGYCQRLVTAELDQASRILDDRQRDRVLNRADRMLARDVPVLPLYHRVDTSAYSNDVRNYEPYSIFPLWNAENWWLDR
jgi:peptide/nickel transport system substrate-binding protein